MTLVSINPATGEKLNEYARWTDEEVLSTVGKVHDARLDWKKTPFSRRSSLLKSLAQALHKGKEALARTITLEMGKPITQSKAEIDKCALTCDYFAEQGESFLAQEPIPSDARKSYVRFDPLGVILAIMPWNFPYWQVFRFVAPALMAGNTVLLKHASNVTGCALDIEALFPKAGFPENIFRTLPVGSESVPLVIRDRRVSGVTLTGSSQAGKSVAGEAGAALKKTVMELGGSDPFVVLRDADLDLALTQAVASRTINSGQSCIAAKRFILEEPIAPEFLSGFKKRMAALIVGDPLSEQTQIGPLARLDLRDSLHRQVQDSVSLGARILLGGVPKEGPGAFYSPTILVDVREGMPAYGEELFGPVAAVILAKDALDAVRIANDTDFGLGASIWTSDLEAAEVLAGSVEAGSVFINGMVKSDPRLPFGGVKGSGHGRELSYYGMKEFVNIKTVWVGGKVS
ncbi:MAG: NAD-dependent succinate-semialdehyde dehydrogenase [Deltaproteobacteria bacterium]